jgi:glycosyltransferase involved in cell wall biosynthesis
MQNQPSVSFCFTTYKREKYLKDTLQSILLQSYQNFEVIVSDNDVEQSAKRVVEQVNDSRFKYFANEQNLGMKKSFNKSLERSTGEYIVMIADDDPVYPDMLETLVNLKNNHEGYGMYLGGSNYLFTHPVIAHLCKMRVGLNSCLAAEKLDSIRLYKPSEFLKDFFDLKIFPAYLWSVCMVKREIIVENGGVPDYGTPFLGDYAYLSIMGSHSGCAVINRALGHQTVHEQNFGRAQNEQLAKVGRNFPDYTSQKIQPIEDWPSIEKKMKHFVATWLVTHLTFLHNFYSVFQNGEMDELKSAEREVFQLDLMKPFGRKYWLKKNLPFLHDALVNVKRKFGSF